MFRCVHFYERLAYMYVHGLYMCLVPTEVRKGHQIPYNLKNSALSTSDVDLIMCVEQRVAQTCNGKETVIVTPSSCPCASPQLLSGVLRAFILFFSSSFRSFINIWFSCHTIHPLYGYSSLTVLYTCGVILCHCSLVLKYTQTLQKNPQTPWS